MTAYNVVNHKRQCFKCNQTVFLNPAVRKKDNPTAFDPLDEAFDETKAQPGDVPKFHSKTCPVMNQRPAQYDYQGGRTRYPADELFQNKPKPDFNDDKKQEPSISSRDFKQLVEDVAYIKGLLEAVIKSFDSARKANSSNTSLLFTQASNMATEDITDEERKNLDETEKMLNEDDEEEEEDIEDETVTEDSH